jgi:hypothetical protein
VAQRLPPLGATLEAPAPAVQPEAKADVRPAASPPAPPPRTAAPAPVVKPPAAKPTPQVAAPEPEAKPKPAPIAALPAKPPQPAPKPALAPPAPAPSAPSVLVERTSWHPKPERRVAWVRAPGLAEARELHEGDAVGTFVVKEIRPSSVLFQHGAEQLQRRVGER